MKISTYFRGQLLGKPIPNFPYPEKMCRYCNKKCEMTDAIHVTESPEIYKALYICKNPRCDVFDEPARKAYAKVYYSSDEAYEGLEVHRIWHDTKRAD